jgi:predicted nucleic acid-binding protein
METLVYADTDFFLALAKERDWLHAKALRAYHQHKGGLVTSVATVAELLLVAPRFSLDPERLLSNVFDMVTAVIGIDLNTALVAAHYMKERGLGAMDALHAAYCGTAVMLSSDHAFDTLGMERIKLEG